MRRGALVTIAGGADYAGKPRPALVVQSDRFATPSSLTVCPITTRDVPVPFLRFGLSPTAENGLRAYSWVMVDKIQALPRGKIGKEIGAVTADQLQAVTEALALFLGIFQPRSP